MDEGWRSFEKLVARIHISLCRDADVKWSEKLIDSSGTERQIDVTIRTRIGPHRVLGIIECKDHKRPVTITDVEAFISLKNDLHASFAVMVSNSGYQEGALKKAELHDIRLWTLQEAQEASWREEIRNFELRYNMFDEIQFDPPIPADAFTQKTSYLSFAAVAISDGARKITLARALAAAIEHATLSGFSIPFWLDVNYEDGCAITMQGKTFPLRCLKVHFADQIAIQQHKNIRVPLGGTYEFKQTDGETHVVNERDLPPIEE